MHTFARCCCLHRHWDHVNFNSSYLRPSTVNQKMRRCTKRTIRCEFINVKVAFFLVPNLLWRRFFAAFSVCIYDGNDSPAMANWNNVSRRCIFLYRKKIRCTQRFVECSTDDRSIHTSQLCVAFFLAHTQFGRQNDFVLQKKNIQLKRTNSEFLKGKIREKQIWYLKICHTIRSVPVFCTSSTDMKLKF